MPQSRATRSPVKVGLPIEPSCYRGQSIKSLVASGPPGVIGRSHVTRKKASYGPGDDGCGRSPLLPENFPEPYSPSRSRLFLGVSVPSFVGASYMAGSCIDQVNAPNNYGFLPTFGLCLTDGFHARRQTRPANCAFRIDCRDGIGAR